MQISDNEGILEKSFYGPKTLKMANWDMGGITLKTILYGQNTLKMAKSRYGGITHKKILYG